MGGHYIIIETEVFIKKWPIVLLLLVVFEAPAIPTAFLQQHVSAGAAGRQPASIQVEHHMDP